MVCEGDMKKIGILSFFWADDFGGMLQCYALKHFVEQMQVGDVEMIPYDQLHLSGRYWLGPFARIATTRARKHRSGRKVEKNDRASASMKTACVSKKTLWKQRCKRIGLKIGRRKQMRKFRQAYLSTGKRMRKLNDLSHDVFLLGSDQIWNPDITLGLEPVYFGVFDKKDDAVTIAYAASLGGEKLEDRYSKEIRQLLKSVDVISVREKSSVAYIENKAGKPVQVMPDPTLLVEKAHWEEIMIPPTTQGYVLIHYTEYNHELIQRALDHARQEKKKVISLNVLPDCPEDVEIQYAIGPAEFLGYIHDADYIFTNSFHATVFSLTFQKQFQCFLHSTRGNRLRDLLQDFGLSVELMGPENFIDYTQKADMADRYRKKAEIFLREHMEYRKANLSDHCKGCGACALSCPEQAIMMKVDLEGFSYPYINTSLCSQCGQCVRVCPDQTHVEANGMPQVYGCKNRAEEIRRESTSGGVFFAIAEKILSEGGIVYGAAMDEDDVVKHIAVDKTEDLRKLQGAKYVESDLGDSYEQIRTRLKERKVLFSGTPCQVAGLKAYVGEHENLYTVDIVCHGVPSQKVFYYYTKALRKNGAFRDFKFRDKRDGWHKSCVSYVQNGKKNHEALGLNAYTRAYFKHLISRKSCHTCQYASFHRRSDLTIGDYWGIEEVNASFDDNKGVSLVLVHTKKGERLFENIKNQLEIFESDPQHCLQPRLQGPAPESDNRGTYLKKHVR